MVKDQEVTIPDLVRGDVTFNTNTLGDFVILRSNGLPVYVRPCECPGPPQTLQAAPGQWHGAQAGFRLVSAASAAASEMPCRGACVRLLWWQHVIDLGCSMSTAPVSCLYISLRHALIEESDRPRASMPVGQVSQLDVRTRHSCKSAAWHETCVCRTLPWRWTMR